MNCKVFTRDDVEKGLHLKLLEYLCRYNVETESDEFFDIHVTTDGDSIIVEWVDSSFEFPYEWFELVGVCDYCEDTEYYD